MEAIREYRNREMLGNTFRKVEPIESDFDKIVKDWKRKLISFSGLCDYDTITENSVL